MTKTAKTNRFSFFKQVVFAVSVALFASFARAQTNQIKQQLPVACGSIANGYLAMSQYKEMPLFVGLDSQHNVENLAVIVFVNKDKKTFTVALLSKDNNLFCAISSGEGLYYFADREPNQ